MRGKERIRYNTNTDLRGEIRSFGVDGKISSKENNALSHILKLNQGKEKQILRQTGRRKLEKLRNIVGLRWATKNKINKILQLSGSSQTKRKIETQSSKGVLSKRQRKEAIAYIKVNTTSAERREMRKKLGCKTVRYSELADKMAVAQASLGLTSDGQPGRRTKAALGIGQRGGVSESREYSGSKLSWKHARKALGVGSRCKIRSTNKGFKESGASRASNRTCLDGLKRTTIDGANLLMKAVGRGIIITGGTEKGHDDLPLSHYKGDKLDFASTRSLLKYLAKLRGKRSFPLGTKMTRRIGGYKMRFYRHGPRDHVDVSFQKA